MLTHKATLILSLLLVCTVNASQELQEAIVKTDVEAVKNILPTVSLDIEKKQQLIDLANDIMLMRLKIAEIHSFKVISQAEYENLEKSLSQKTIGILRTQGVELKKWYSLCKYTLSYTAIGTIIAFGSLILGISQDDYDIQYQKRITLQFFFGFLSMLAGIVATTYSAYKGNEIEYIMQNQVRSNLQQLYQDSIGIKHLIANTAVTI